MKVERTLVGLAEYVGSQVSNDTASIPVKTFSRPISNL